MTPADFDGDYVLPRRLRVGDTVLIAALANNHGAFFCRTKTTMWEVQAGHRQNPVKLDGLRLMEKPSAPKPPPRRRATARAESRLTMAAKPAWTCAA